MALVAVIPFRQLANRGAHRRMFARCPGCLETPVDRFFETPWSSAWRPPVGSDIVSRMITRQAVHALIDDLDERELELVARAVDEIRQEEFELSEADEQELARRETDCDNGDRVELRELLTTLRGVDETYPHR